MVQIKTLDLKNHRNSPFLRGQFKSEEQINIQTVKVSVVYKQICTVLMKKVTSIKLELDKDFL